MSQNYPVKPGHTQEILREAVEKCEPATLSYRGGNGWIMLRVRLIGMGDEQHPSLLVDLLEESPGLPEAGQEIGIAFRRGHRKCVFTSRFTGIVRRTTRSGREQVAYRLSWPDVVDELQRRLYHRTLVPAERVIPVELWLAQAGGSLEGQANAHRGRMIDLSAGGLSVELPREFRPRFREDDQLACRFAAEPGRHPVEVTARVSNYVRLPDGHVRVGLQFVGLDACERGRQTLHRIHQMTDRLRRVHAQV